MIPTIPQRNSTKDLEEVVGEENHLHESNVNYSRFDKLILAYVGCCSFRLGTVPAEAVSDYINEGKEIYLLAGTLIPTILLLPFVFGLPRLCGYIDKYFKVPQDIKKKQAMTKDLFISGIIGTALGGIYFYSK